MDLLMITQDANVLRENSAARASVIEQSKLVNRMFVIVLNTRRDCSKIQRISEKVWFIPTNSWFSWLAPFDAMHVARRELFFQGRLQVDLVDVRDACESGLVGLYLSKRYGTPLHTFIDRNVFTTRFIGISIVNVIRSFIAHFVVLQSSGIYTVSENIRESLVDFGASVADRTVVCPKFIDIEPIQNEPIRADLRVKYPQFKFIILVVGPFTHQQNIEFAVRILAEIHKQYKHAGLVIVGEGSGRHYIRALARTLGVQDHVVIENPTENIISYYKTAGVFLVTARYEDYNDSILTASASGAAIVTSKVGVAPSIIVNGESGFLCDLDNIQSFVDNIMLLINKPATRGMVGINSASFLEKSIGENKQGHLQLIQNSWERAVKNR